MREQKEVVFEVKQFDDTTGRFSGLGSVYGNVDWQGDMVMPGAFTKSLQETGAEVPLLWQHKIEEPIGLAKLRDSDRGLLVDGQIDIEVPEGRRAYSLLKRRIVKGLSIGYDTVRDEIRGGVRRLLELKLWELSVVTFPANPLATVTAVKAERGVEAALLALRRNVIAFKAGRVLSGTNLDHLRGAIAHLDVAGRSHAAVMEHLNAIHDAATAPPGDPDPDDPMDPNEKALAHAIRTLRRTALMVRAR